MDETPVWFDMAGNITVNNKGDKTVHIRTTGNDKNHFTVVLTCSADGTKYPPICIFKEVLNFSLSDIAAKVTEVLKFGVSLWLSMYNNNMSRDTVILRLLAETHLAQRETPKLLYSGEMPKCQNAKTCQNCETAKTCETAKPHLSIVSA
ncbi:hypothetical protein RhiirC2_721329 [Rhizophagus irregularis]|uniref:Uncharacterized protein n=1 Tax=Rhizophagus irregularis TaxID=588596 RepID=A0A2N1M6M0_9GLOM|nr:hypothetical protein RhiirC2_721329 [Rhizophagus irregularis]